MYNLVKLFYFVYVCKFQQNLDNTDTIYKSADILDHFVHDYRDKKWTSGLIFKWHNI